jgi:putative oxidoreductase
MSLSRRIARPMLASIFISGGLDAVRNPEGKVKSAEAVTVPLTRSVPWLPQDPEVLVRLNGAAQVGAGALLAVGKLRRLSAIVLIGSIIPTTYAGHRFWEEIDDVSRAQQKVHLLKNLGLLGGLILAAVDTEGAPSMGWRARRSGRQLTALAVGRTAGSVKRH